MQVSCYIIYYNEILTNYTFNTIVKITKKIQKRKKNVIRQYTGKNIYISKMSESIGILLKEMYKISYLFRRNTC